MVNLRNDRTSGSRTHCMRRYIANRPLGLLPTDAWRYAFMGLVRKSPEARRSIFDRREHRAMQSVHGKLDAPLGQTGAYVAGASFTLADTASASRRIAGSRRRWTTGADRGGGVL